jgi:hypothetical protein
MNFGSIDCELTAKLGQSGACDLEHYNTGQCSRPRILKRRTALSDNVVIHSMSRVVQVEDAPAIP